MKILQRFALAAAIPMFFMFSAVAVLIFVIQPSPALAVNTTIGSGTPASCTEAQFNAALVPPNIDSITFNCGAAPVTITFTTQKFISRNLTIDGGNKVTLSGGGSTRIFNINQSNLITFSLRNLTLANASATGLGAAIFNPNRTILMVSNTTFINNQLISVGTNPTGGGAIFLGTNARGTIVNSTFISNAATVGGAVSSSVAFLTVTNSIFTGNRATATSTTPGGAGGGAIHSDNGTLLVISSTIRNNQAIYQGGGIFSFNGPELTKTTTIISSTIENNNVVGGVDDGFGGGIFNGRGSLTIVDSTLANNRASSQGGGLWSGNNATVVVSNTTIANNRAVSNDGLEGLGGGVMRGDGDMNFTNVTIAGNFAGFQGGGVVGDTNVTITNTIIANNVAFNGGQGFDIRNNCLSEMTDGGNNLQFPDLNPNDPTDVNCTPTITIGDPRLAGLARNGGPTPTMALLPESPAIDTGLTSACPARDQRGVSRPQNGDNMGAAVCDIGAFEASISLIVTLPTDNGQGVISGTLSFALRQAQPGQSISFALTTTEQTVVVSGTLPTVPSGVSIVGGCGETGPTIIIDGAGASGVGLTLTGGNYLFGLQVTGFQGPQIKTTGLNNRVSCVRATSR